MNARSAVIAGKTDYQAILNNAWQSHLAPRETNAPTVVSLFSGIGSSLGYSIAGYSELLAVDFDENVATTFKRNFPGVLFHCGDIAELSDEKIIELTGLKPGELDLLDGSPPCVGFSMAGRRNFHDPRNTLFKEYLRVLRLLKPKTFVMENVQGLFAGKMRLIGAEIIRELKASGYKVSVKLLDSQYFHVPQARKRVIFLGCRSDLRIEPTHPKAQSWPISAQKALEGLVIDEEERQMLLAAGQKYAAYKDWHLIRPGRTRRDISPHGGGFSACKFDPRKPARTLVKSDCCIGLHGSMHWNEPRRFTVGEMKRFSSIPDDFELSGSWSDGVARLGNCVPALLMAAIARHIRKEILEPKSLEGIHL